MRSAIITVLFFVSKALAIAFADIKSFTEAVVQLSSKYGDQLTPEAVQSRQYDSRHRRYHQDVFRKLADRSQPVFKICHNKCNPSEHCKVPPFYPFTLPLTENQRNDILKRPSPSAVHANIRRATGGKLSTVSEVVGRLNVNLLNLGALSDAELTLLGSNFHSSEVGVIVDLVCHPLDDGLWAEDLVVSQDEQRALTVGLMYISRDPGYQARIEEALRGEIRLLQQQRAWDQDHQMRWWVVQLLLNVPAESRPRTTRDELDAFKNDLIMLFFDSHGRGSAIPAMSEDDWLARYDGSVATLRKQLRNIDSSLAQRVSDQLSVEESVASAEDNAGEIFCAMQMSRPQGLALFMLEQEVKIKDRFHPRVLRQGLWHTLLGIRWRFLSEAERVIYSNLEVSGLISAIKLSELESCITRSGDRGILVEDVPADG